MEGVVHHSEGGLQWEREAASWSHCTHSHEEEGENELAFFILCSAGPHLAFRMVPPITRVGLLCSRNTLRDIPRDMFPW